MKTTKHRIMIASLLFCGLAVAEPEGCGTNFCNWKTLEGQRHRFGCSEERVGTMLEQCRRNGLSAEEADRLLAPVRAAQDEALPAEAVFTKIEEGLAKKVPLGRVVAAAELRLDYLRRASRLVVLQEWGEGQHSGGQRLVVKTALALESGLPEEVLREIFSQQDTPRYGRLGHVLEVGETLQLAGLDPQDTKQIMMDCLDRNMNRMAIQRAVDYIVGEHRKGRSFKSIRADLWIGSESS